MVTGWGWRVDLCEPTLSIRRHPWSIVSVEHPKLIIELVEDLSGVERDAWDALVGVESPFVEWAWLRALEETGCVSPDRGWLARHVLARDESGALLGAMPMYIKGNSFGEFVYDWAWADLAMRLGQAYYPKTIVASPFSPVAGPRLLVSHGASAERRGWIRDALVRTALTVCEQDGVTGLHVLFATEDEVDWLARRSFFKRIAFQYHWHNDGYADFDDFLARFQSKRRREIRRERRQVHGAGYTVVTRSGDELTERDLDDAFRFYASTCERYVWGRQYLERSFFTRYHELAPNRLRVFFAQDASGEVVAGTFNLDAGGRLFGRYWGSDVDVPLLHFETCYYAMISWAIEHGYQAIEPGAGGDHKYSRGFEPVRTFSAHHLFDPRLEQLLRRHVAMERRVIDAEVEALRASSPLRRRNENDGKNG